MMKKILTYAVSALALASCSSDSLVSDSPVNNEAPIAFNVGQRNITRGDVVSNKLEDNGYLNFGVWANKYKAADSKTGESVMVHYLVGFNDASKGYAKSEATTGTWFYEGLGNDDSYIGTAPYVTSSTSVREHQYLRYWDLSYNNTKFFAYAPYDKEVTFTEGTDGSKIITVPATVNQAGTDHDVIYAGTKMTNSNHDKVPLHFKHLGAKVNLKFYHNIPGYKVELLEVTSGGNDIQATPATPGGTSYVDAHYFTKAEATIKYNDNMVPTASVDVTGEGNSDDNLVFKLPDGSKEVPAETTGTQNYLESPTTYYAVAQPKGSTTGFTFHVSFQLTAKDNNEVITVKDARVFVPASVTEAGNTTYIAAWQPNTKYTYTFKITKDTKGTTSGAAPNVDDPTVPDTPALYPIIFDNITIVDYENDSEYTNKK
ncbi:MAG: fimbrillin family protein [Prevotella sp.]|nr:fimbrillin family protein [Prevotella sp.]